MPEMPILRKLAKTMESEFHGGWTTTRFWMGSYGAPTPKPSLAMGNTWGPLEPNRNVQMLRKPSECVWLLCDYVVNLLVSSNLEALHFGVAPQAAQPVV